MHRGPATSLEQFAQHFLFVKRVMSFRALPPVLQSRSLTKKTFQMQIVLKQWFVVLTREVKSSIADGWWEKWFTLNCGKLQIWAIPSC